MWKTIIYNPLLNSLVLLLSYVTFGDLGFAVILLTILIKIILFPLSKKAVVSQIDMASIQADLADIKSKKLSKEEEAKETFALYKAKKVNPFSGCLVLLIQLPIIFGLYRVFLYGLDFSTAPLYSFVHAPAHLNTVFLGSIHLLDKHSIFIAILAGLSQYLQVAYSPAQKQAKELAEKNKDKSSAKGFGADFQKSMQMQMKYFLPLFIAFIAYKFPAAVGLYWVTNNLVQLVQEQIIAKHMAKRSLKNDLLHTKVEVVS